MAGKKATKKLNKGKKIEPKKNLAIYMKYGGVSD